MKKPTAHELILDTLKEKACLKQQVYKTTYAIFQEFKVEANKLIGELGSEMCDVDKDVTFEYIDKSDFEFQIKFGGDVLVFFMHTNVFDFDKSHNIWKSSYVKEDRMRTYCGMINIYNFLADSFKYNRVDDIGYLVARCFVNKDEHYFVEGKRQLGFLYNDFINETINTKKIKNIIESSILYSMEFDLLTPRYEAMSTVSVQEINEVTSIIKLKTGKRLGFKFQNDSDDII
ncbi:MAG: hypothetical protein RQ875_08660 [Vicingaceae bacterium]|nr:hypothetical protein [Vicingaceae bacterium]